MRLRQTWIGVVGQDDNEGLAFDGPNLLATVIGSPLTVGQLIKIDTSTMTEIARWVPIAPEGGADKVLVALGFYYVACFQTTNPTIVRVDPATMTSINDWTSPPTAQSNCISMATDGVSLFAGLNGPANHTIYKLNPITFAITGGPIPGMIDAFSAMTYEAPWLYASHFHFLGGLPYATIERIDPATFTINLSSPVIVSEPFASVFLNGFLYVAFSNPGQIVKYDPVTMSPVASLLAGVGVFDLCTDGTYLYGSCFDHVIKVEPNTMHQVGSWIPVVVTNGLQTIATNGNFVYAGQYSSPANVFKLTKIDATNTRGYLVR